MDHSAGSETLEFVPKPENVGTPTFLNDGKILQKPNNRQGDRICGNSCKFPSRFWGKLLDFGTSSKVLKNVKIQQENRHVSIPT